LERAEAAITYTAKNDCLMELAAIVAEDIGERGTEGSEIYISLRRQFVNRRSADAFWIIQAVYQTMAEARKQRPAVYRHEIDFDVIFRNKHMRPNWDIDQGFKELGWGIEAFAKPPQPAPVDVGIADAANAQQPEPSGRGQADEIIEKAKKQADDIIAEAQAHAEQLVAGARIAQENQLFMKLLNSDAEERRAAADTHFEQERELSKELQALRHAVQTSFEGVINGITRVNDSMGAHQYGDLTKTIRELDSFIVLGTKEFKMAEEDADRLMSNLLTIRTRLNRAFSKLGILEISPGVGERFDPEQHEDKDPDKYGFDYSIANVIHSGYRYGGEVIAKALVETKPLR
jgi:molecular chaperone GrpE (heat shock protein)